MTAHTLLIRKLADDHNSKHESQVMEREKMDVRKIHSRVDTRQALDKKPISLLNYSPKIILF